MFSTFLHETKVDRPIIISVPSEKKLPVSTPISIPKKSNYENHTEYELNLNFFNPSKMSPPDCWKTRLEQRIKNFYESKSVEKE